MDNKNDNIVLEKENAQKENAQKENTVSLMDAVAEMAKDNDGLHVLASQISPDTKVLDDTSTMAERISFAEAKLQRHYALKDAMNKEPDLANQSRTIINIETLTNILKESQIGALLFNALEKRGITFQEDIQVFAVQYHKTSGVISVNTQITYGEAIYYAAREMRRAFMTSQSDLLYPLGYLPDEAILLNRVVEADARVMAIWMAWELKLQNIEEPWDYAMASNESYMALAFSRLAKADFRSLDNGDAARAAFDSFFASGIIKRIDHRLIQEMLSDEKGYVFTSEKPASIVTSCLIDAIGEVPSADKNVDRNYLMNSGEKPLPGTEYASVRDRSNANFLWFVKFEKSFQETETIIARERAIEKERMNNTENKGVNSLNIKEIAQKDEKIVDFEGHFRQKLEGTDFSTVPSQKETSKVSSKEQSQALDQSALNKHKGASSKVINMFDRLSKDDS